MKDSVPYFVTHELTPKKLVGAAVGSELGLREGVSVSRDLLISRLTQVRA